VENGLPAIALVASSNTPQAAPKLFMPRER